MRFMDEVHVGDHVTVADLQTGKVYEGHVIAKHDAIEKVDVRYTSGRAFRVGVSFVQVTEPD